MFNFSEILANFEINGNVINCERVGSGHINDTYAVTTACDGCRRTKYILQRINDGIFPNVKGLMNNQVLVNAYVSERLKEMNLPEEKYSLRIVPTKAGDSYIFTGTQYYRVYHFIDGAVTLDIVTDPNQLYLSGKGFGRFQRLLDGFPTEKLFTVIPDFHNTEKRFAAFVNAVREDKAGRASSVKEEIAEFIMRKTYCARIVDKLASGEIPTRVTHNDTKINNIMLDLFADEPLAVIDLDTVMPGSVCYDFGDSIRSGATTGDEDERDLTKVNFSLPYFRAYAEGFLQETKAILTRSELDNLAFGAILMTYECGMRFLTDHLNGDVYFRIHRENQNLDRARTQLKLVNDMESQLEKMQEAIECAAR